MQLVAIQPQALKAGHLKYYTQIYRKQEVVLTALLGPFLSLLLVTVL